MSFTTPPRMYPSILEVSGKHCTTVTRPKNEVLIRLFRFDQRQLHLSGRRYYLMLFPTSILLKDMNLICSLLLIKLVIGPFLTKNPMVLLSTISRRLPNTNSRSRQSLTIKLDQILGEFLPQHLSQPLISLSVM